MPRALHTPLISSFSFSFISRPSSLRFLYIIELEIEVQEETNALTYTYPALPANADAPGFC